jgi:hypothetical protein
VEQRVRTGDRPEAQFPDSHGSPKLRKRETAKIDTAERGNVAGKIGFGRRFLNDAASDAPAPRIPRAEFVRHIVSIWVNVPVCPRGTSISADIDAMP